MEVSLHWRHRQTGLPSASTGILSILLQEHCHLLTEWRWKWRYSFPRVQEFYCRLSWLKILPHITRRKRGSAAVFPSLIVSSFSARFCFDVAQNDVFYQLLWWKAVLNNMYRKRSVLSSNRKNLKNRNIFISFCLPFHFKPIDQWQQVTKDRAFGTHKHPS